MEEFAQIKSDGDLTRKDIQVLHSGIVERGISFALRYLIRLNPHLKNFSHSCV